MAKTLTIHMTDDMMRTARSKVQGKHIFKFELALSFDFSQHETLTRANDTLIEENRRLREQLETLKLPKKSR